MATKKKYHHVIYSLRRNLFNGFRVPIMCFPCATRGCKRVKSRPFLQHDSIEICLSPSSLAFCVDEKLLTQDPHRRDHYLKFRPHSTSLSPCVPPLPALPKGLPAPLSGPVSVPHWPGDNLAGTDHPFAVTH